MIQETADIARGAADVAEILTASYVLGKDVGVETLMAGAGYKGHVSLTGNNLANTVEGGAGNDTLKGGGGIDLRAIYTTTMTARAKAQPCSSRK